MKKFYGFGLLPFLVAGLMIAPRRAEHPSRQQDAALPGTRSQRGTTTIVGQSRSLMPDGRWLILGGQSPTGFLNTGEMQDPRTGAVTPLATGLLQSRAWHTATLLPSGKVLIFGGVGADGRVVTSAEMFDPATQEFQLLATPSLTARAHHTATLLTDGTVLIAGGILDGPQTLGSVEAWDPQVGSGIQLSRGLLTARHDHTATLLADGEVLFWGGRDSHGEPINYGEIFDPKSLTFRIETSQSQTSTDQLILEESIPSDGSEEVPAASIVIALRFSKPLLVTTVNTATVSLSGPAGAVSVQVVPAEGGMLAFVTPQAPLTPATSYSLTLSGVTDLSGNVLPQTIVGFTTAGTALAADNGAITGTGNDGNQPSETQPENSQPLQASTGVTALSGQSLKLNGSPLEDLTIQDETSGVKAETDGNGRFLLRPLIAGHHILFVDGRTAKKAGQVFGTYEIGVDITAGKTNVLNYKIWMTPLDTAHAVRIQSPTGSDIVVSNPSLPGLELHIPKGTTITDHEGKTVRELSITPIPLTQPPFPLPQGVQVPIYFTIQPGAAYLTGNGVVGWQGAQLYYPNQGKSAPGTRFDFWNYDPDDKGWYIYGHGTVSANGKQVVPDPDVQIYEFTGAMVGSPSFAPPGGPPAGGPPGTPGGPPPSPAPPPGGGDPVSLSTGLFDYTKTDLTISDILPVSLTRTYRPGDSMSRAFGVGSSHAFDMFLVGDTTTYQYVELILPDGSRIRYNRTSSGVGWANAVFVHSDTTTMYYGSVIVWNGGGWNLTLRNGTVYIFPDGSAATIPQQAAIIGIKDRYGNTVSLTRDSNHNLAQITTPNNRWIQFTYDSSHRITQALDNIGRTVSYSYDSGGRLSAVTDANGGTTTYTYDSNSNMLTITDPRGITYITNQYDSNNRVIKQTMADGSAYQFAYTLSGNSSQTHFVNSPSSYTGAGPGKDVAGFRACQGCSEGYTTQISQVDITDQRGFVRRVVFSPAGYTVSDTRALDRPVQQTTTYQYYPDNLLKSITDPLGRTTSFVYDTTNNDVTQVTRLSGTSDAVTTTSTYESAFNQIKTVTDPLSHTTTFIYDSIGNMVAVVDPIFHETSFTYNAAGQPLTATDALNNRTSFSYDSGDLVSITDPLSRTVTRFLDGAGRLVSVTNPLGQSTRNDYDALNEITKVTDPAGNATSFSYDGNGNLLSVTDANSHATTYTYDNMDRLLTRTDPLTNIERYQYDPAGNLTQFTDRRGKITIYDYDSLNRKTLAGFGASAGTPNTYDSSITYRYDGGNRLLSVVDSTTGTITPEFDVLDRLISEQTPQGTVSYVYDLAGRRTQMTVAGQAGVNYAYDNANRLLRITQGSSAVSFGYDNGNRRTSLTLPNGIVTSYSYDNGSELTGITYTNGGTTLGTLTYGYDLAGRRTIMGGTAAQIGLPLPVNEAEYNANNQLTEWGTAGLYYDPNGNMISDGVNSLIWNARNQMSSMNSSAVSFQYDPSGRRSAKTVAGVTTNYLYDGANVTQEISGGSPIANLLSGGTDEVFTRTDSSGTANFLTDALGSTIALTDGSGSTLVSYAYDPFGNTAVTSGSSTNEFQYTGRESDSTGLYFSRARYYSPILERFISEDPLAFGGGGPNFYAYVLDNPISYIDQFGLSTAAQQAAIQAAAQDWANSNVPYKWGGATKQGADCSGAVDGIYQQAGIDIGRMTSGGFANSPLFSPVSGEPSVGDIGVYNGHVVIYGGSIGGANDVWSASHTNGPDFGPAQSTWYGQPTWYTYNGGPSSGASSSSGSNGSTGSASGASGSGSNASSSGAGRKF